MAADEAHVVVDDMETVAVRGDDSFETQTAPCRNGPLETDEVRDLQKSLDEASRDADAGPKRVVEDDADTGHFRRGDYVLVEIVLGVTETLTDKLLTNTRQSVMSLCLNAHRNRLRVPSSLDLSSAIDLIASRQAKRERFSLGFRGGVILVAERWSQAVVKWEIPIYNTYHNLGLAAHSPILIPHRPEQ